MKTRTMQWIGCVALGALVGAIPPAAQAGQKEWATAGKILTGVVAYQALQGVLSPSHTERVTTTTVVHHPAPVYRARSVRTTTYRTRRAPLPYRHHPVPAPGYCPSPAPPVVIHHSYPPPAPITVYQSGHRRLYQPAVPGHPAFVQQWSPWENRWVTIQDHPSIW
ncbi:MAG: hypothetical protein K9N49_07645 [Candidatus Marinimicrobia bacterium]|nr:hypothetical protein [Candidatus Neomarinimicrobiota bacterium]